MIRRCFAEIVQDKRPQTAGRETVFIHLFQAAPRQLLELSDRVLIVRRFLAKMLYEKQLCPHVLRAVQEDAAGRSAVTSGSAGFLIVAFHVAGHVVMDHV